MARLSIVLMWIGILISACGDDDADVGPSDANPDAVAEAGADAELDAAPDASEDAAQDADTDAMVEPPRARLMYVSVRSRADGMEPRIATVTLEADGSMTTDGTMDLPLQQPAAMSFARTADRLYVGTRGTRISTIGFDASGVPMLLGETEDTGRPVYIATVRSESVMVSADFMGGDLRTFDVSGAPPHRQLDRAMASVQPHAALPGPDPNRVYVPHRDGGVIQWWDIAADGELQMAGELDAEPGVGPRHIIFSPDARFAYVINEFGDSVSAYTVEADGSIERIQTIGTIPGNFDGDDNTCADVHVTPDGRFLYGSNRGHDSIAMFEIGGNGMLTELGQVPTQERPREFELSPDGRYVVVAGQDSGALESYRVEPDGRLMSLDVLPLGADLRWVVIR